MTSEHIPLAWT